MSYKIEGHQLCLICHPDLNKKFAKRSMKGMKRLRHSIAIELQESERLLDLLVRAEQETVRSDDD